MVYSSNKKSWIGYMLSIAPPFYTNHGGVCFFKQIYSEYHEHYICTNYKKNHWADLLTLTSPGLPKQPLVTHYVRYPNVHMSPGHFFFNWLLWYLPSSRIKVKNFYLIFNFFKLYIYEKNLNIKINMMRY